MRLALQPISRFPAWDSLRDGGRSVLPRDATTLVGTARSAAPRAGLDAVVEAEWTDRVSRYERSAEIRVEEFGAHADDDLLDHQDTNPADPA